MSNRRQVGRSFATRARPDAKAGRPLWLFLTEPGLGPLLGNELKFRGVVEKKAQFARLNLRNHDLLVLPDAVVRQKRMAPRLASNVLVAPVFGRGEISEHGFDRLAAAIRRERSDEMVRVIAGEQFSAGGAFARILEELGRRGVRLGEGDRACWFVAVDDRFYFGFPRFNQHEAPGRTIAREREGSLPTVVAAALVFAAKPAGGEVIWDPAVGTGTILAEAAQMTAGATLTGSDIDAAAIALAKKRLSWRRNTILTRADSSRFEFSGPPLTLTISNLPFGKRFKPAAGTQAFYEAILRRSLEHAAPEWRAVLLTSDGEALSAAAERAGLSLARTAEIKVRGEAAAIWVAKRG